MLIIQFKKEKKKGDTTLSEQFQNQNFNVDTGAQYMLLITKTCVFLNIQIFKYIVFENQFSG